MRPARSAGLTFVSLHQARFYKQTIVGARWGDIAMDATLKHKSSMIVVGPTMSGKTTFVENLIRHRSVMYDRAPQRILWFTGSQYEQAEEAEEKYIIYEGLPESFDMVEPFDLVVLDDLMNEMQNSKVVSNLFTRMVHHTPCTVISLSQNLFQSSKEARTRALNTQYMVLFKNPRDATQIGVLARQMYPGESKFITDAYKHATGRRAHGYLFIDLHQETPEELRVQSQILPNEAPNIVYIPPGYKHK